MIRWRKKVEEYIELRRSLGFKLLDAANGLIQFERGRKSDQETQ
jgi:hypothetical protein